jgi:GntR family transcriptional regulator
MLKQKEHMIKQERRQAEPGNQLAPTPQPRDGMPRYVWIREQLVKRIVDGTLRRGEALPSEGDLAKEFGVSLGTLRKAIDGLVEQHVLVRRQGKRTFIATRDSALAIRLSFHVVAANDTKEYPAFGDMLSVDSRQASEKEAAQLSLEDGAHIIDMKRTRVFADGSIILEHVFLPKKLFPNFKRRLGRQRPVLLYEFYDQEFGVSVMNFEERIRAIKASKEDAAIIGCKIGTPLLEIERTAYSYENVPVEIRVTRCETSDRYYLHPRR